jgi:putative transposase
MAREDGVGDELRITQRRLPHWEAGGATYFLGFSLANRDELLSVAERRIVREALLHWHGRRWRVHMLTVMPGHVHALATPLRLGRGRWHSLSQTMQSVKGHTAREINKLRQRRGVLWQHEGFDHLIRSQADLDRTAAYIRDNAVKMGLVDDPYDYDGFWCEGPE